ncbi:hypothetical protein BI024_gp04 [Streptomyces phage Nanodon]|uniref:Uncharacterized protein n=1 Tax=Streptomyces phage Nanodon TaxID=1873777 RepID=A0A1B1PAB9_9CAUD|nr:hypothetical protein BI024_gp04 [Streptomyces phage Nanodon]ANT41103.1 hypothetical protein SEA_NANODON_4 [Streptomyces phage Nanodon]
MQAEPLPITPGGAPLAVVTTESRKYELYCAEYGSVTINLPASVVRDSTLDAKAKAVTDAFYALAEAIDPQDWQLADIAARFIETDTAIDTVVL